MISGIIHLILSIPKFLELTQKFISFLQSIIEKIEEKKKLEKFTQVATETQTSKNTQDLDAMFDPRKKKKK